MALRCFIAMAFDRKDTDELYDRAIKPLLKRKGITPFRVDRSNRNDDIDDQILAELERCDFVIADLTYARPSVYFEAGVAQGREVKVIYTCRRDHFKHQPDDRHGNFRVHFDLQMKPIIPWNEPPTAAFSRRLDQRINGVTRPLIEKQRKENISRQEAKGFAALSLRERRERLSRVWMSVVRDAGFRSATGKGWPLKKVSGRVHVVRGCTLNKLTRAELQKVAFWLPIGLPTHLSGQLDFASSGRVTAHLFYISLAMVTRRMVEETLPDYRVSEFRGELIARGSTYVNLSKDKPFRYRGGSTIVGNQDRLNAPVCVHVISGIQSEAGFKQTLIPIVEAIR